MPAPRARASDATRLSTSRETPRVRWETWRSENTTQPATPENAGSGGPAAKGTCRGGAPPGQGGAATASAASVRDGMGARLRRGLRVAAAVAAAGVGASSFPCEAPGAAAVVRARAAAATPLPRSPGRSHHGTGNGQAAARRAAPAEAADNAMRRRSGAGAAGRIFWFRCVWPHTPLP